MKDLLKRSVALSSLGSGGSAKPRSPLPSASRPRPPACAIITVDPARRLREAPGTAAPGRPGRRGLTPGDCAPLVDPALKLSAMMLDVKGEWDAMVTEHVADPAIRRRILDSAFYQSLSTRFAGSDAHAAGIRLHEGGKFRFRGRRCSPPAAHVFQVRAGAPARLMRLLDSQAARWLVSRPRRSASLALRLCCIEHVARELERFAGGDTLSSIADFFAAASGAAEESPPECRSLGILYSPTIAICAGHHR